MQLLLIAGLALPFIIVLDLLWLGVIMKDFYRAQLGHLMGDTVVWGAAIVFYLVYAFAIAFFVVSPALARETLVWALCVGAALGFVCYATYDLTNQATLRDWPLIVTVADIIWGAFLTAVASGGAYLLAKQFLGQ